MVTSKNVAICSLLASDRHYFLVTITIFYQRADGQSHCLQASLGIYADLGAPIWTNTSQYLNSLNQGAHVCIHDQACMMYFSTC